MRTFFKSFNATPARSLALIINLDSISAMVYVIEDNPLLKEPLEDSEDEIEAMEVCKTTHPKYCRYFLPEEIFLQSFLNYLVLSFMI